MQEQSDRASEENCGLADGKPERQSEEGSQQLRSRKAERGTLKERR